MHKHAVAGVMGRSGVQTVRRGLAGLVLLGLGLAAIDARAQDQKVIVDHGISTFGTLKYPADFKHLDYVNPDAPKGGEIAEWAYGTFDSVNMYSIKGNPASSGPRMTCPGSRACSQRPAWCCRHGSAVSWWA